MRNRDCRTAFGAATFTGLLAAVTSIGCGGSGASHNGSDAAAASDGGVIGAGGAGNTLGTDAAAGTGTDGGSSDAVGGTATRFSYKPAWPGATRVQVIGGFGRADDWKNPLATLTNDGTGTFAAAVDLPPGQYPYLFQVLGDADAKVPATESRPVIDPLVSAFMACPAGSPTAGNDKNPCSVVTVPQAAADPVFHIRGVVQIDGAPVKDWLVLVERDEMGSHHFAANRLDTGADGAYDFSAAPGSYRLQVLPADGLKQTDASRDVVKPPISRRALSSSFKLDAADVALDAAELAFHDYGRMMPADGNARPLPIALTFTLPAGAKTVRAAVYAPVNNVGDSWWTTAYGTVTTASFDGMFNTPQATETMAVTGKKYWWGVWADSPKGAAGVIWTRESLVFPLLIQ